MSELVVALESLEVKIGNLLQELDSLVQSKSRLADEIAQLKAERKKARQSITDWEEKYESLKLANSMLGSETNKTEAKLKINTLIRELDACIAQLAE